MPNAEHRERVAELKAMCRRWRALKDAVDRDGAKGELTPEHQRRLQGTLTRRLRIIERLTARLSVEMGVDCEA